MNCGSLALTGSPLRLLVIVGVIALFAGIALVLLVGGGSRRRIKVVLAFALIGAGLLICGLTPTSAMAASTDCATGSIPSGTGSLIIVQTSSMTGLAPGVAFAAITGTVTNHSSESTFVTDITVSVASVTRYPNAASGPCDVSDYVIRQPAMPVGQTLAGGTSVSFAGAEIGFNDKSVNQDACQNAVVNLRYLSS
jgi:hypothetical protein